MAYDGFATLKDMSDKIEGIRKWNYTIGSLFPDTRPASYFKNKILMGWDTQGKTVWIDVKEAKRIIFVGKPGSGKTIQIRAMADRCYMAGHIPVILTDIKNEYKTSRKPVQAKFRNQETIGLAENETPTGFNIITYFPAFLQKYYPEGQGSEDKLIQLSLSKINQFDLMTILGFDNASRQQKDLLLRAFLRCIDKKTFKQNDLEYEIFADMDAQTATKDSIVGALRTAYNEKILGDEYSKFNFADEINEGGRIVLNVRGITRMGANTEYLNALIAVLARNIIEAKKQEKFVWEETREMPKIFYFIDEAHRWIPNKSSSTAKREILNIAREERSTGVTVVCATQQYDKIDEVFRKMASYILFPWNIDTPTATQIMKDTGLYKRYVVSRSGDQRAVSFTDSLNRNLQKLKERSWVLIDTDKRNIHIIRKIVSPLSYHSEEI